MAEPRSIFFNREAWKRFLIAVVGLAGAFLLAVLSTTLRDTGNMWLIGTAASLSLLLAGFVGLYAVPYLAKRAALEGVRDIIDYDVTREGTVYLGGAMVIGIAALNTGNNLLFIIFSTMMAAVLVSGIASAMVLRRLRLEVSLPAHIFAGQSMRGRVHLENPRVLPTFSVSVVPPMRREGPRFRWEPSVFHFPPNRPPEKRWVSLRDRRLRYVAAQPLPGSIFHGGIYFPYIPRRSHAMADVDLNFKKRGRYVQDDFGLSTRFPFSFLKKTRRIAMSREIIVYPSVEATDDMMEVLPLITGEFEAYVRGRGHDLYMIRDLVPGDPARSVDWKATAKSGSLKVREFMREDERRLRIVFDNPQPGEVEAETYEKAVSLAASLAWHFEQTHAQVSFLAPGYSGSPDIMDFLRYLALVQPAAGESVLAQIPQGSVYNLVLTPRRPGRVESGLWTSSYVIYMETPAAPAALS